jgi:hypothetical protein
VALAAVVALLGTRAADIPHEAADSELLIAEEDAAAVDGIGPAIEAIVPADVNAGDAADDNGER